MAESGRFAALLSVTLFTFGKTADKTDTIRIHAASVTHLPLLPAHAPVNFTSIFFIGFPPFLQTYHYFIIDEAAKQPNRAVRAEPGAGFKSYLWKQKENLPVKICFRGSKAGIVPLFYSPFGMLKIIID